MGIQEEEKKIEPVKESVLDAKHLRSKTVKVVEKKEDFDWESHINEKPEANKKQIDLFDLNEEPLKSQNMIQFEQKEENLIDLGDSKQNYSPFNPFA